MDDELELHNFKKTTEVLADIWTDHVIDNYPVTASFDHDNTYAAYLRERSHMTSAAEGEGVSKC